MNIVRTHDIIVIGAGSGGLTTAVFMRRAGFSVLLIDRSADNFGGDCLNYGCVPSKSLLHVASQIYNGGQAGSFRKQTLGTVDVAKVMAYVRDQQTKIRVHENPGYFEKMGIDVALGEAEFTGKDTVTVSGKAYRAKRIVVATGSRPREIELEGIDLLPTYSNETIFSITELPKDFVFIGGGPINVELGQAFARLGSKVAIIQTGERILDKEEAEVSEVLTNQLEAEGVTVLCNASPLRVEAGHVVIKLPDASMQKIAADALFVGIGRIPNVDNLNLEKAGVVFDGKKRLQIDHYLRTANKRVSVVGDAAGQYMFTHAAELQAATVLNNMFAPFKKKYSAQFMAWTTFCDPEIATFGANHIKLQADNKLFKTIRVSLDTDDRAITEGATAGFLKLYIAPSGHLLGGVMVGHHAGEIASELILMMTKRIKLTAVLGKTFPYPIASRVIQAAARQYAGKRLESRLNKWLLHALYRLS